MPWFAWFSEKQAKLYGYALYLNKKGEQIIATELNQDSNFKHQYKDSVRLGQVTHFIQVLCRNGTKRVRKEYDKMLPNNLEYKHNHDFQPNEIIN